MILVVAEKKSVAENLANVIGANQKVDNHYEGNDYIVSWCSGSLTKLAEPKFYDSKYRNWGCLPVIPNKWFIVPEDKKRNQLNYLIKLMNRTDITEIINACDAERQGEYIFRCVYCFARCNKPVKRLWISSLEDDSIINGFNNLKVSSEYDNLYKAAVCRAKADWLVGMNATRLFTTLYKEKLDSQTALRVGRVTSPTLSFIVERENEILNFKPETYYNTHIECDDFIAVCEGFKDENQAKLLENACKGSTAKVIDIKRTEKVKTPPMLYNLTDLQCDANRLFGYSAKETLNYLQKLYELKIFSYPRTDSRYITSDMANSLPQTIEMLSKLMSFVDEKEFKYNIHNVVNDKEVYGHYAIIPTKEIENKNKCISNEEEKLLELICLRILCAVSSPYTYCETKVILECNGKLFKFTNTKDISLGWKAIENEYMLSLKKQPCKLTKDLPKLEIGQVVNINNAYIKKIITTPPERFTEDTLLRAMENAGVVNKKVVDNQTLEDIDFVGLGTAATRADIIEKLVKYAFKKVENSSDNDVEIDDTFVKRIKDENSEITRLAPTEKAMSFIKLLPEELISPKLTVKWEDKLNQIENGKLSSAEFIASVDNMVYGLVEKFSPNKIDTEDSLSPF